MPEDKETSRNYALVLHVRGLRVLQAAGFDMSSFDHSFQGELKRPPSDMHVRGLQAADSDASQLDSTTASTAAARPESVLLLGRPSCQQCGLQSMQHHSQSRLCLYTKTKVSSAARCKSAPQTASDWASWVTGAVKCTATVRDALHAQAGCQGCSRSHCCSSG